MKTSRNEIAEAINKRKLVLFETVPMTFEVKAPNTINKKAPAEKNEDDEDIS